MKNIADESMDDFAKTHDRTSSTGGIFSTISNAWQKDLMAYGVHETK